MNLILPLAISRSSITLTRSRTATSDSVTVTTNGQSSTVSSKVGGSAQIRKSINEQNAYTKNISEAESTTATASSALADISSALNTMKTLAVFAKSATISTDQRNDRNEDFLESYNSIASTLSTTKHASTRLLDGNYENKSLELGRRDSDTITLSMPDVSLQTLGIDGMDLSSASEASDALTKIEAAITKVDAAHSLVRAQNHQVKTFIDRNNISNTSLRGSQVDSFELTVTANKSAKSYAQSMDRIMTLLYQQDTQPPTSAAKKKLTVKV